MNIAIVGGGFTGLAAAKKLLEAGHTVEIIERNEKLGGLAASTEFEDTKLEIFYHHIFSSDNHLIDLIEELGLEKDLQWLESKMGFWVNEKIYEFGTPVSLLKFSPLNLVDKFRFGLSVLKLQALNDWKSLENITAKEWLLKNSGEKVYKICWEPLLTTKFGEKHDKIAMSWFWGKIKLRGSTRSKSKTKELLGYMEGSFEKLGDRLVERIQELGGKMIVNTGVAKIKQAGSQVVIETTGGEALTYDQTLVTVPLPLVSSMVEGLPQKYVDQIDQIEYTSAICTILTLKKSFSDIYWLNIGDTEVPFGGLIEHTNMVKDKRYNGKKILYISNYLFENDPLYNATDAEIMDEYMKHLQRINPDFNWDWIEKYEIFKARYAQPIVVCNYSAIKPDFTTPLSNIYVANMTHIYPEDRGMNYAIRTGYQVAEEMLSK